MGVAGNVLLIVPALASLALFPRDWQDWTTAAGTPLGWIALISVVPAIVYRRLQSGRSLRPQAVGLLGMTVLGLLACTVQWLCASWNWYPWGYRTLMLGWATYAWFIVTATWWVASVRTLPDAHGPPQALIRAAAVWVRVAGILAVLLGLKAACFHPGYEELLWAAASIAVASAAGATMAVWRRQEGWAFAAALGVNLAASLTVWYFHRDDLFEIWWLRLVQANVIASSAVALIWLAVRRRLYQLRELTLGESPLLAAQTALPAAGNVLLLIVPVVWLLGQPSYLPDWMHRLADAPGWLGLLLAAAAAGWYLFQAFPGNLVHMLAGLGLGAGVLVACQSGRIADPPAWNAWCEYHVLITAWTAVAFLVLGIGFFARKLRLPRRGDGQTVFPGAAVQTWVTVIGAAVLALAVIYAHEDYAGAWWRIGATIALSVMAGLLAIWRRQSPYVYVSGLLLNVAGTLAWMVWGPSTLAGIVQTNVLCLAIGSGVWSLMELVLPQGVAHPELNGRPLPFSHLAARVAVGLLAATVLVGGACDVLEWSHLDVHRLDWLALGITAAAVTICLWDRCSRFALPGLYVLGLTAVGMGLWARNLSTYAFCHSATVELAAFVLATAILGAVLPELSGIWRALQIPEQSRRWPDHWLPALATALTAPLALLSLWISIDTAFDAVSHRAIDWLSGRAAGPLAVALLLPAAILLVRRCRDRWRGGWQQGALALGLLWLSEIGFVWLVPQQAPWMHRGVIVMVAAVLMTLVASLGLSRLLPGPSDWAAAGRRITPAFGALAFAMLAIVLGLEGWHFVDRGSVPMAPAAIAVVAVALAAMAAACIGFAVRPDWDPFGLTERQRTVYVYAAEVLAALIGLHIWLTMPWLFSGLVRRFWMLIVMVVAFIGAGLSEWFHRRKMPVLAEPLRNTALLLPLAPAVGFWFMPDPEGLFGLLGRTPAVWFLMGLFYGVTAINRRSLGLGALAILTGNMGLWVLWHQQQWTFFDHPQLWLIPLALAVLVAEHLDRGRLSEAQRTGLRYLALGVIYVSSTTEFMRGVYEQSVILPLVLIGLSVAGVLAGVLLRVRSFLYLGVTFLGVVIVRMIVYAAFEQGQMWIFWTCCILLGAAIIGLFAVFEKRRNDVLLAVERFKDWNR